jgi:hypothetical protein
VNTSIHIRVLFKVELMASDQPVDILCEIKGDAHLVRVCPNVLTNIMFLLTAPNKSGPTLIKFSERTRPTRR